jgi:hypothetical protein
VTFRVPDVVGAEDADGRGTDGTEWVSQSDGDRTVRGVGLGWFS